MSNITTRPGGRMNSKTFIVTALQGMSTRAMNDELQTLATALDAFAAMEPRYHRQQAISQAASDLWDMLAEPLTDGE
ncbi:MAG: hypothetical protein Q4B54_08835 [Coriobacteriales bacterium]|nr:hypothetical protein [Coriobacteriales bacterium]